MYLTKYLSVLLVLFVEGESGGHGGKHYDHLKLYVPEFHHHDLHTKVITIHHHHKKPKKEHHHHHHHHHPQPQIPSHHFHHQHKKSISTHTETKGHKSHHGHSGHHGHHNHQGHHGHEGHGKHHDVSSVGIDSGSSFGDDFETSFTPSVPSYGSSIPHINSIQHSAVIPQIPHVTGVQHTVKQVKVYNSFPGAIPQAGNSNSYEVTEEGEEDDTFTSVNSLQQSYPATYGYVHAATSEPYHDPFAVVAPQTSFQTNNNPFVSAPAPIFSAPTHGDPFSSSAPESTGFVAGHTGSDYPISFESHTGFDDNTNSYPANGISDTSFLSDEEKLGNADTPVTFSRQVGIQQSVNTGGVESIVYK